MSKKHKGLKRPAIHKDRIFYWAYGSNLCVQQMRARCPRAVKSDPLPVQDSALVFRSVADVTVREGSVTPGGLWLITEDCERTLDAYEGVAQRLYLKRYFNLRVDGRQRTCLFYQMRTSKGIMPPTRTYLSTILRGYADFGLDPAALKAALDESWQDKSMTAMLHERAERNGWPRLARELPKTREEMQALVSERMRAYRPVEAKASVDDTFGPDDEPEEQDEGAEHHGGLTE